MAENSDTDPLAALTDEKLDAEVAAMDDDDAAALLEDDDGNETEEVKNEETAEEKAKDNVIDDKEVEEVDEKPEEDEKVDDEAKRAKAPELVELSSDEDEEEESSSESEDDEVGDPGRPPGDGADREIDADHLLPFHHGWRREVVMKQKSKEAATTCDIYYIPPSESRYRTREAKRKRASKMDQEQYFNDFPSDALSIANFNYVKRPLGLKNAAYEIVRKPKKAEMTDDRPKKKSYKEVEESRGLLSESESEDEEASCDKEVETICGLSLGLPITMQVAGKVVELKAERKRRKKRRDPETCCTPPLAEDMLWTALDDDSLGVYTDLGGRSSPCTPPPLRAVKLTRTATAEKIGESFRQVRKEAGKSSLKGPELVGSLSSHDIKIKQFKHVKAVSCRAAAVTYTAGKPPKLPNSTYSQLQSNLRLLSSSKQNIMGPVYERMKNLTGVSLTTTSGTSCSVRCAGANRRPPTMQCISCRMLYHAKCQGISQHVRMFKCRSCLAKPMTEASGTVKMKLPMPAVNGKRPAVEIVMFQNNVYRPIKFSNNMTVTEVIPKRIFQQANATKKTIYLRAKQVPRVGSKPLYLAVNPAPSHQSPVIPPRPNPPAVPKSDQVSILVRKASASPSSKPVLLNVPRKVAVKVKKGTTLSFSASDDQKYVVVDNRIHPPLKTTSRPIQPAPRPVQRPVGMNIPVNLPGGLSIQRTNKSVASMTSRSPFNRRNVNVLSSGEVVAGSQSMAPCTPYCPGVSGFPELECKGCKSLFHGKCVGVSSGALSRIQQSWMCKMCAQMGQGRKLNPSSSSVQVIDLD